MLLLTDSGVNNLVSVFKLKMYFKNIKIPKNQTCPAQSVKYQYQKLSVPNCFNNPAFAGRQAFSFTFIQLMARITNLRQKGSQRGDIRVHRRY